MGQNNVGLNWNFDYYSVSQVNFDNIPSNLDTDIDFDIQLVKREDPIIYYLEINDKWRKYSQLQIKDLQNTID